MEEHVNELIPCINKVLLLTTTIESKSSRQKSVMLPHKEENMKYPVL